MEVTEIASAVFFWAFVLGFRNELEQYFVAGWLRLRTRNDLARYTRRHRGVVMVSRWGWAGMLSVIAFRFALRDEYTPAFDPYFWGPITFGFLVQLWLAPVRDATGEEREQNRLTMTPPRFDQWLVSRGPSDRSPGFWGPILWLCCAIPCLAMVIEVQFFHEAHDYYLRYVQAGPGSAFQALHPEYAAYSIYRDNIYNFENVRYLGVVPACLMFVVLAVLPTFVLIGLNQLFSFVGLYIEHLTTMVVDGVHAVATIGLKAEQIQERRAKEGKERGHQVGVTAVEVIAFRVHGILTSWLTSSFLTIAVMLRHATEEVTMRSTANMFMVNSAITLLYLHIFNINVRREQRPWWFVAMTTASVYVPVYYMVYGGDADHGGANPFAKPWHWLMDAPDSIGEFTEAPLHAIGHYIVILSSIGIFGAFLMLLATGVLAGPFAKMMAWVSGIAKSMDGHHPILRYAFIAFILPVVLLLGITIVGVLGRTPVGLSQAHATNRTSAAVQLRATTCRKDQSGQFPCTNECFAHWRVVPHRRSNGSIDDPACHY